MPATVDFALSSNGLNFVVFKTRSELLKTVPEIEYFRFKQFYHTFAYAKQNRWGIEVDGSKDPTNDRWHYIYSLNDALQLELARLFKILQRHTRQNINNGKRPGIGFESTVSTTYINGVALEYEES